MKTPSPALGRRLAEAIALRAVGASWAAVAHRLRRSVNTCMHWPSVYRAAWDELYDQARDKFLDELTAEARNVLQKHLRLNHVRDQREAAKLLLTHADRNLHRPATTAEASPPKFVGGLNDEQAHDLRSATDDVLGTDSTGRSGAAGGRPLPG
jgi:hypothetical protein